MQRFPQGYNGQGYGAGLYEDLYYPDDDYEGPRESTFLKLIRELKAYREKKKKKKKKRSSSESSDDDRRNRQQAYQPISHVNVAQPALVTHYPAYGPPIQSIQYVMTAVPVSNNQPPAQQPVAHPRRPSSSLDSLRTTPITNRPPRNPFSQLGGAYPQNDQQMFYPEQGSPQFSPQPSAELGETGIAFGPDEENLLQTLLRAKTAQMTNNARAPDPFQVVPTNSSAFTEAFQSLSQPNLSGTGAAIANFQRLSNQTTPSSSAFSPNLSNFPPVGAVQPPQPFVRSDVGITNLQRLNEPGRVSVEAAGRPINVWPDRLSAADEQIVRLQIDSKLYVGENIVERLQELECPRYKLDNTPVSRMIVMLVEGDDVRPENYQLVGEDNIIMKWSAMMGDYRLRDGARLRLRRRTKPGRVATRTRAMAEPSRMPKSQRGSGIYSRLTPLPSAPVESQGAFSRFGDVMY